MDNYSICLIISIVLLKLFIKYMKKDYVNIIYDCNVKRDKRVEVIKATWRNV